MSHLGHFLLLIDLFLCFYDKSFIPHYHEYVPIMFLLFMLS